jgi:Fic family protein
MPRLYNQPHQFEPLLPGERGLNPLLEKAHELLALAHRSTGRADVSVMQALAPFLRSMNSYYTNKIEGQHTLPSQLEGALRQQFSTDAQVRRKQRVALAHIEAEKWAEQHWQGVSWRELFEPEVLATLHQRLFHPLEETERLLVDGTAMQPGQWRSAAQQVKVGQHEAPDAASLAIFLRRFADVYKTVRSGELAVVALAAAHHRLAWIHPFPDGNGRVARLHSHLLLTRTGLTNGIWSPLRGLARTQPQYYQHLAEADMPRHGDLDGRGNLSEKKLIAFIDYFLDICIDQARFMSQMLDMQTMRERIRACLAFESAHAGSGIRMEAELPLHTLFIQGAMERGEFKQSSGLAPRTAERLLSALLTRGLVRSESPKGKLIFGVPHHALRFYFPTLWPEAEAML